LYDLNFCFCIYLIFIKLVPNIFVSFVDPISRLRILQWPKGKIKRKYFFLILFLYHVILCRVGKVFKPFWWFWFLKSVRRFWSNIRRFGCIDAISLKDFVVADAEFVVVVIIDVLVGHIIILRKMLSNCYYCLLWCNHFTIMYSKKKDLKIRIHSKLVEITQWLLTKNNLWWLWKKKYCSLELTS